MRFPIRWSAVVAAIAVVPFYAAAQLPTQYEQYQLELLNRARANPNAEVTRLSTMTWGDTNSPAAPNLNEGIAAGTISSAAKQPLAFNTALIQAAQNYSSTLLANDAFTHTFSGTTASSRMAAAGYASTPPSGSGENLAVTASSGAFPITAARVMEHHNNLFIDGDVAGRGHRINIMNASWREVGIGIRAAGGYELFGPSYNAILSTQNFAYSAGAARGPFITGVAYQDVVADNFYTPEAGEALGNLTVTVYLANTLTQVGTTTTFASGGYAVAVPNGTYDVRFTGSGHDYMLQDVAVNSLNVKVDFVPVPEPMSVLAIGILAMAGVSMGRHFKRKLPNTFCTASESDGRPLPPTLIA